MNSASGASRSEVKDRPAHEETVSDEPQPDAAAVRDHRPAEFLRQTIEADRSAGPVALASDPGVRPLMKETFVAPRQEPPAEVSSAKATDDQRSPVEPPRWTDSASSDWPSESPFPDKEQGRHEQADLPVPQSAPAVSESQQHTSGSAATFTVGSSGQLTAALPERQAAVGMDLTATAVSEAGETAWPTSSKSVVFEVAQSELGRVQVRLAMTHDVVHAHFTSDRPDIGTLLWNGQDRLQSALQASGLDMGQFRVDLERQGAGRSFHQGPSQEEGRAWQHPSDRREGEPPSDSPDGRRGALRGMLNLVA